MNSADNKIGEIGQTGITRGLDAAIKENEQAAADLWNAYGRYLACDWGELDAEDKAANDAAVKDPGSDRIIARYKTAAGDIYIITECDRSATTFMLCSEY